MPTLPSNVAFYPVECLKQYIKTTNTMRTTDQQKERLFLTTVQPHTPATTDTVSRWLKKALKKAGVNTNHFKAHSARGAATTAAVTAGVTMADILAAADWRGESTFLTRYYRPHPLAKFRPIRSEFWNWNVSKREFKELCSLVGHSQVTSQILKLCLLTCYFQASLSFLCFVTGSAYGSINKSLTGCPGSSTAKSQVCYCTTYCITRSSAGSSTLTDHDTLSP